MCPRAIDDDLTMPGGPPMQQLMLGVRFDVFESVHAAAQTIIERASSLARHEASTVLTCNVDHVLLLRQDSALARCYERATFVTVDGMPLVWLASLLRRPIGPRVTGADLLPALAQACRATARTLVIIGGADGVSALAVDRLRREQPGLDVHSVGAPGPGFVLGGAEDAAMVDQINALSADVVAVCFGAPRQELWMEMHRADLPGATLLGAGAAVDFLADTKHRAPRWMQRSGLEWFFRLTHDFQRLWRRYLLRDSRFVMIAAGEIMRALRVRDGRDRAVQHQRADEGHDPHGTGLHPLHGWAPWESNRNSQYDEEGPH